MSLKLKYFIRTAATVLAFSVLVSSIGIYVDFHICQGEIVSVGVFSKAEKCSSFKETSTNKTKPSSPQINRKSCCNDVALLSINKIENHGVDPIQTFNIEYSELIGSSFKLIIEEHPISKPYTIQTDLPPPRRSFHILFEKFLI